MLPVSHPSCLSVLSVQNVLWSDWGLPRSIEAVLIKTGHLAPRHEVNEYSENPLHRLLNDGPESRQKKTFGKEKKRLAPGKLRCDVKGSSE